MEEEWRDVKGYEGYQVSNLSNVKSLNYRRTGKEKLMTPHYDGKGRYLLIGLRKNGVRHFKLLHRIVAEAFVEKPEELKNIPFDELEVDHINTDTHNNSLDNLRWTDRIENHNNPLTRQHISDSKKGKQPNLTEEQRKRRSERMKGEKNPFYGEKHTEESKKKISENKKGKKRPLEAILKTSEKLAKRVIQKDALTGEIIVQYNSMAEAEKLSGCKKPNIINCCKKRARTAGGFTWEYAV